MTVLNFPPTNSQPSDGSFTYTANGVVYTWDGEKWTANTAGSGGMGTVHFTGDSPPPAGEATETDQWFNTNDGRLYTYTKNANGVLVWVDASPDSDTSLWERTGTTLEPTNAGDTVKAREFNIEKNDGDDLARIITNDPADPGRVFLSLNHPDIGGSGEISYDGSGQFHFAARQTPGTGSGTAQAFYTEWDGVDRYTVQYDGTTKIGGDVNTAPNMTLNAAGNAYFTRADGFNPEGAADWGQRAAIRTNGSFGGGIALIDGLTTNSPGYCIWLNDSGSNLNIGGKANQSGGLGGAGVALAGHAATSWTTRSDERDKENLVEITDGLNKVGMLRAVTGNFIEEIDPTKTKKAFLIAQDVLEVQPEAVSSFNTNEKVENQRYGIAYTEVIPLLVSALHDAKDRIEDLEAKVQQLEGGTN